MLGRERSGCIDDYLRIASQAKLWGKKTFGRCLAQGLSGEWKINQMRWSR
ncbi:hypothetical protein RLEG3_16955 [Rhizobium leguminosarum bv. trifolii WSM1689]|nr:hypothetical protein RLEG3_16955 [Rhizobium leguminosarum bv. trifolii WSM1689]